MVENQRSFDLRQSLKKSYSDDSLLDFRDPFKQQRDSEMGVFGSLGKGRVVFDDNSVHSSFQDSFQEYRNSLCLKDDVALIAMTNFSDIDGGGLLGGNADSEDEDSILLLSTGDTNEGTHSSSKKIFLAPPTKDSRSLLRGSDALKSDIENKNNSDNFRLVSPTRDTRKVVARSRATSMLLSGTGQEQEQDRQYLASLQREGRKKNSSFPTPRKSVSPIQNRKSRTLKSHGDFPHTDSFPIELLEEGEIEDSHHRGNHKKSVSPIQNRKSSTFKSHGDILHTDSFPIELLEEGEIEDRHHQRNHKHGSHQQISRPRRKKKHIRSSSPSDRSSATSFSKKLSMEDSISQSLRSEGARMSSNLSKLSPVSRARLGGGGGGFVAPLKTC